MGTYAVAGSKGLLRHSNRSAPFLTLLLVMALFGVPAAAEQSTESTGAPQRFLICDGFNRSLDEAVRHYIALYQDRALIDGIGYRLEADELFYSLDGPPLPGTDGLGSQIRFKISRLTGAYETLPISGKVRGFTSPEWSRPEDRGCVAVQRKL